MKDEKIQIPEDRAKLYETITGFKPSDNVEIKNSATSQTSQLNNTANHSDAQTNINSICLILRWIACLIPLLGFIISSIHFGKSYYSINEFPIDFTFVESFSLSFNFFLKILTIFASYAIFSIILVIGINIIEFIIYSIMILFALSQKNKAEKEFNDTSETIKHELNEMDKKDEEKKKANKSVDFSNIE